MFFWVFFEGTGKKPRLTQEIPFRVEHPQIFASPKLQSNVIKQIKIMLLLEKGSDEVQEGTTHSVPGR